MTVGIDDKKLVFTYSRNNYIIRLVAFLSANINENFGPLSNRIGEELLGEALTVITQLVLPFDLREKYNQCD